jgi:hypothetical protein
VEFENPDGHETGRSGTESLARPPQQRSRSTDGGKHGDSTSDPSQREVAANEKEPEAAP